jgi:hypothetical protein
MLDAVIQMALDPKVGGEKPKNHHTPTWFLEAGKETLKLFN